MGDHKRVILCGPAGAGKDYICKKLVERGYDRDVSYTTRSPREGEKDGVDYHFISEDKFIDMLTGQCGSGFYEDVKHEDHWYGTSMSGWCCSDVFIMETKGIELIWPDDRKNCLIIYVNTPFAVRLNRLRERGWSDEKILKREEEDQKKFKDFNDYDLEISSVSTEELEKLI